MTQHLLRRVVLSIVVGAFLLVAGEGEGVVAAAQETKAPDKAKIEAARAFFKGKSIEFIVPYSPGGNFDLKVRVMVPYLEKYLSGIKVLVKNVPGAGGTVGTNQLYVAKPNGLTFAILNGPGALANQLGSAAVVKYDAAEFTHLGRISAHRYIFIAGLNSSVKDLDSLLKSSVPVKQALTGAGSGVYAISQIVIKALGFPREEVLGFPGQVEAQMSVIRGETDTQLSGSDDGRNLLARKEVRAIFQLSPQNMEGLERIPNLLTKDIERLKLSEAQLKRVRFAGDLMMLGYILAGPPRIPPERAWLVEEAVQKTLRNPEFVALCQKSGITHEMDPLSGKEISKMVGRLKNITPDLKAEMQELMKAK